jgi:hypothetical protein
VFVVRIEVILMDVEETEQDSESLEEGEWDVRNMSDFSETILSAEERLRGIGIEGRFGSVAI